MIAALVVSAVMLQGTVAPTAAQAGAASYQGVFEAPVTLVAGRYDGRAPASAGGGRRSAGLSSVKLVAGDLDGDRRPEAVVVLWAQEPGRDRRLYLAVLARAADGTVRNVATAPIGDRLEVRAVRLEENRVFVETAGQARKGNPSQPARPVTRMWAFADGALIEAEGIARD